MLSSGRAPSILNVGAHDFSTLKPDLFGMVVHDLEKEHKLALEKKNTLIKDLHSKVEDHALMLKFLPQQMKSTCENIPKLIAFTRSLENELGMDHRDLGQSYHNFRDIWYYYSVLADMMGDDHIFNVQEAKLNILSASE